MKVTQVKFKGAFEFQPDPNQRLEFVASFELRPKPDKQWSDVFDCEVEGYNAKQCGKLKKGENIDARQFNHDDKNAREDVRVACYSVGEIPSLHEDLKKLVKVTNNKLMSVASKSVEASKEIERLKEILNPEV